MARSQCRRSWAPGNSAWTSRRLLRDGCRRSTRLNPRGAATTIPTTTTTNMSTRTSIGAGVTGRKGRRRQHRRPAGRTPPLLPRGRAAAARGRPRRSALASRALSTLPSGPSTPRGFWRSRCPPPGKACSGPRCGAACMCGWCFQSHPSLFSERPCPFSFSSSSASHCSSSCCSHASFRTPTFSPP
jgi:hypothetical protein